MENSLVSKGNKIQYLDGIRGMAAIFVVFSHCLLWFCPQLHTGIDLSGTLEKAIYNSPVTFFFKGSSAVTLFFVLSGYVLSSACAKTKDPYTYIPQATKKRYLRLGIPVFFSVLISYLLTSMGAFDAERMGSYSALSHNYTELLSINKMLFDAFIGGMIYGSGDFNYVLWTINIEFFGSLLVYGIMAIFHSDKKNLRFFSLTGSLLLMTSQTNFLVYQALFLYGCFLSTFERRESLLLSRSTLASIVLMLLGLYLHGYNAYAWRSESYSSLVDIVKAINTMAGKDFLWDILIPAFGSILIISCVVINQRIFYFLGSGLFTFYGKLSFSIYLLHSFILAIIAPIIFTFNGNGLFSAAISSVLVLAVTTVVAIPFYKYVDLSSIRIANSLPEILQRRRRTHSRDAV